MASAILARKGVSKSLQKRASAELADAQSRAEMHFAQRKNLRIARFLERLLALNLERAAEEAKAGKVKRAKTQRTKEADELV